MVRISFRYPGKLPLFMVLPIQIPTYVPFPTIPLPQNKMKFISTIVEQ